MSDRKSLASFSGAYALGLALFSTAWVAQAAPITWGAVQNETGNAAEIITGGSLHGAVRAGSASSVSVNGVSFAGVSGFSGGVVSFGSAPIKLYGMEEDIASYGSAPGSWGSYGSLVSAGGFRGSNIPNCSIQSGTCPYIEIANLTIGQAYDVQILESFWNYNWATQFSDGSGNSVTLNQGAPAAPFGSTASSVPQYVVGRFTADQATQRIYMNSTTDHVVFTAMQVRTANPVPEPTTLLLVSAALMGVGVASRRARRCSPATAG
ncbi:PEP-CTERM sorting domain-containing protein [Rubrivivax rivuli]|nr:PEP-CTERM sorting domain-containing protein [Rubrivivax rivuli]